MGLVIIILTAIIRLILYPLNSKTIRSQRAMQTIQPKMDALKQQYKDNQEELAKAMMKLYKDEGVNPFSSCLPLLIQFPFLIALFYAFQSGLHNQSFDLLYSFVANSGSLNLISFGFLNLDKPNIALAVVAGAAQFVQTKLLMAKKAKEAANTTNPPANDMATTMNKQMLYVMPVITVVLGAGFPSGLALYWLANTVFMVLQQLLMMKKQSKV